MSFDLIFKRFGADWQKFGWMGLGSFLVQLVAGVIAIAVGGALLGTSIMAMIRADYLGVDLDPGQLVGFLGSFLGFFVVALVFGAVAGGLSYAGLIGSVAGYRRGEEVGLGSFWNYATRYFGKMILLGIIFVLIMLLSMVLLIIPFLGWLAFFIWVPTASVVLGIYPAYLIVAQDYDVTQAVGTGFRVLTSQFGEALLSGALMLGLSILLGLIGAIPLIGWLVVGIFGQPLLTYIFTERFELVVRPHLSI